MKNLEIYLDDGTKVFECIVSNQIGIVKIHHNILMKSVEQIIKSVIDGKYKIEFKNKVLDTSKADTIFDRIELFKNEENFQVIFDVVTPQKVLEYVYQDNIPLKKDIKKIVKFFNIHLEQKNDIKGIGEALFQNGKFIINYKKQYYKQREIFTIAHELGHIFLHFATDKKVHFEDFDDELETSNDEKILKAARSDLSNCNFELEREADVFAKDLLVPAKQLRECIEKYEKEHKSKPRMCYLKDKFGVSNGTIFYALKDASLLHKVVDDCRWWL